MHTRGLTVASAILLTPTAALAQLAVETLDAGVTPDDLVAVLLGPGVEATNVSYLGASTAAGVLSGAQSAIGFDSGIVLGSGNVGFIVPIAGVNADDGLSQGNGMPGDADLDPFVPSFGTFDAAVLEFDVVCATGGSISIEYVMASEEYNEFVNGFYNDAFAIFVNGVNVAVLSDGVTPVSINTVNGGNPIGVDAVNPELFINNDCDDISGAAAPCAGAVPIEMDGLTVVLTADAPMVEGVNHIKIAIADGGDDAFDSNVMIRSGSITCGAVEPPPEPESCVRSPGAWAADPDAWPVESMVVGSVLYSADELQAMLVQPARGNALVRLARPLISARLNEANGAAVPAAVAVAMDAGDLLIGDRVVPPVGDDRVRRSRKTWRAWGPVATELRWFNAGVHPDGPEACGADAPPIEKRRRARRGSRCSWSSLWKAFAAAAH